MITQKLFMKKYVLFAIMWLSIIRISSVCCEESPKTITPRIVGGHEAVPGAWPFIVELVRTGTRTHLCAGSLIHRKYVVTAGHCLEGETPSRMDVRIGIHDISKDVGERIPANKFYTNPKYDNITFDSDIALIELVRESQYTPVTIARGADMFVDYTATIMGWGKLSEYGRTSNTLQQADVIIVSNNVCDNAMDDEITANMLCAGLPPVWNVDACQGDSGGPIVIRYGNETILVGVVSWGNGCATYGQYGVYTRVSKFDSFIDQYITSLQGDISKNWRIGFEDALIIFKLMSESKPNF